MDQQIFLDNEFKCSFEKRMEHSDWMTANMRQILDLVIQFWVQ